MRRIVVHAGVALSLIGAPPAFATPLPEGGVTLQEMAGLLTKAGLPASIKKDSNGVSIVSSRVSDVNFDVYLYDCNKGRCGDIQFAAGWSNANVTLDRVNEWNTTKRFLRVYWKSDKALFAEQDARVRRGTTENINEALAIWKLMLGSFKSFMHLN